MFGVINKGRIIIFDIELDLDYYSNYGKYLNFYIYYMKSKIEIIFHLYQILII